MFHEYAIQCVRVDGSEWWSFVIDAADLDMRDVGERVNLAHDPNSPEPAISRVMSPRITWIALYERKAVVRFVTGETRVFGRAQYVEFIADPAVATARQLRGRDDRA